MENQLSQADLKLRLLMKHASMGLAEIDEQGAIVSLNRRGEELLKPVLIAHDLQSTNLFTILDRIVPDLSGRIRSLPTGPGNIMAKKLYSFSLSFGEEVIDRHFMFTVTKIFSDCLIVEFDDVTENILKEKAIMELVAEKAVAHGKYEIASNVLHDIGNALVGFGSYINRIKRSLEQQDPATLQKLTGFFSSQQQAFIPVIGEAKAGAVVDMLRGMTDSQKKSKEEIRKSVTEQLNIINHIQEILHIQKQYLNGHASFERKKINLRAIINDCVLMLYASLEKRGIHLSVEISEKLPDISADRTRLMQVILNILKNSVEAIGVTAHEKKIIITAKIDNGSLVLSIRDNGQGFDEATRKELFTRGFTTKASGTGLGLANCKAIVESHEGRIDISSDGFGKGAVTTIIFKI